jgi:hypothetical protein
VQFSLIVITNFEPPLFVHEEINSIAFNSEFPRLRVVARWCQYSILKEESQTVGHRTADWITGSVNFPTIGVYHDLILSRSRV